MQYPTITDKKNYDPGLVGFKVGKFFSAYVYHNIFSSFITVFVIYFHFIEINSADFISNLSLW